MSFGLPEPQRKVRKVDMKWRTKISYQRFHRSLDRSVAKALTNTCQFFILIKSLCAGYQIWYKLIWDFLFDIYNCFLTNILSYYRLKKLDCILSPTDTNWFLISRKSLLLSLFELIWSYCRNLWDWSLTVTSQYKRWNSCKKIGGSNPNWFQELLQFKIE